MDRRRPRHFLLLPSSSSSSSSRRRKTSLPSVVVVAPRGSPFLIARARTAVPTPRRWCSRCRQNHRRSRRRSRRRRRVFRSLLLLLLLLLFALFFLSLFADAGNAFFFYGTLFVNNKNVNKKKGGFSQNLSSKHL